MHEHAITIEEADQLTEEWVYAHVDMREARRVGEAYPNRPEHLKLVRPEFEPGPWMMERDGTVWRLVVVRVDGIQANEPDWEMAMRWETTQRYVQWFREGHHPPPIRVWRNGEGALRSGSRRRWLAAREAGVEWLLAYYSPTLEGSSRPKWRRKPCTYDRTHVCTVYRQGGDCTTCPDAAQLKARLLPDRNGLHTLRWRSVPGVIGTLLWWPGRDHWRLTRWRENGPSGHDTFTDADLLLELARDWTMDPDAGAELEEWSNAEEWERGLLQCQFVACWNACSAAGRAGDLGVQLHEYAVEHGLPATIKELAPAIRALLREGGY